MHGGGKENEARGSGERDAERETTKTMLLKRKNA